MKAGIAQHCRQWGIGASTVSDEELATVVAVVPKSESRCIAALLPCKYNSQCRRAAATAAPSGPSGEASSRGDGVAADARISCGHVLPLAQNSRASGWKSKQCSPLNLFCLPTGRHDTCQKLSI